MRLMEATMSDAKQRALAMQTQLRHARRSLAADKLLPLGRRDLVRKLDTVMQVVARDVGMLPRRLMIGEKNLPGELKRVQRGCLSIVQALNDKVIKRSEAIRLSKTIVRRLRAVDNLLSRGDPNKLPQIVPPVEPDSEPANTATAAMKPHVKLKSFNELEQYQQFLQDMRNKVRMLETQEKDNAKTEPLTTAPITPATPSTQFDAGREGRYGQRLQEDVDHVQNLLRSVQPLLPKQIKFKPRQLYQRLQSPLLVVTTNFVSDEVFKAAHIKFARLYQHASLSPGYTPGFGGRREVSLSPLILYNQWLIAVPLPVAMDAKAFNQLLEYAIPALGEHVGGVMPVPVGGGSAGTLGRFTREGTTRQPKAVREQITRLQNQSQTAQQQKLDYLRRLQEGNHAPMKPIPPEELLNDDAALQRARRQKVRPLRIFDDKRRYFTNKHYPGVAFVWLILNSVFSELSQVRFVSVSLPVHDAVAGEKPNKSAEEQASYERMNKLQQAREGLVGDLSSAITNLETYVRDAMKRLTTLQNELEAQQTVKHNQQRMLAQITDHRSPQWRAAQHAMELTLIHIGKVEGEIQALETDVLPKANAQRRGLTETITTRLRQAAATRKLKK